MWGQPVHAFFYNGTMQDLGMLRSGTASYATSLNDQDLVVGNDALNGDSRPWIWSATSGDSRSDHADYQPRMDARDGTRDFSDRGNSGCGCCWYRRTWVHVGAGELNTSAGSSKPFVPAFRRRYTADPRLPTPDPPCGVSKQQVARLMHRATKLQRYRWSEHPSPLSGSLN